MTIVSSPRPLIQPPPVFGQMLTPRRAFSRRSVSAGHRDLPGASPQSLGGIRVRLWRPVRIMILISVLFVGLGYDPTRFQLNLPFLHYQGMLAARPILDRGEPEPIRTAILSFATRGMTGDPGFVGVPRQH